ncbi:ferredoxin-type protein NapF [Alisedimentitalea sp. MJ-SS2]|uniref:ferredoxin-type protein NapF n=1 Tax=Aliisedimentitalea sp. MJ-SS2 TaxID=3049795 RepID=UPI0029145E62|nr:ferredoxin-type protein NapF [Alisedimentitalea sp. MJ-SS2]MDU8926775.1 ferredoxin-type protein NapF [Alisedimentitalea sp. MJ-SS2]
MGQTPLSRRDLFSRFGGGGSKIRPPFSHPEELFLDACTACSKCIAACPQKILVQGRGGYPEVNFAKAQCTFCGACAEACEASAFAETRAPEDAWPVRAAVADTCLEYHAVSCRACESWCDEDAIRFRPALGGRSDIFIDTARCTGCGACATRCPQGALSITQPGQIAPADRKECA